ncbi:hypothetical protein Hdeb2414_s0299g00860881 [Helianthus debilis subsp. tardiflorus]
MARLELENHWRFEYLVSIRFLEVLAYLLPLCNEDTGPVTLALTLIFWGCDTCVFGFSHVYQSYLKHVTL